MVLGYSYQIKYHILVLSASICKTVRRVVALEGNVSHKFGWELGKHFFEGFRSLKL